MDKNRKLRRYSRKDYSQLVDFPVEIVGRDGVVRRYSFEESVRLYQRRIASAVSRYTDLEIAHAEQLHCRRRIEQLRRSYFARYGWSAIQKTEEGVGELAGEVAAFLRRYLDGTDLEAENLSLSPIDEDTARQVYYASCPDEGDQRFLLYVYQFNNEDSADQAREDFFGFLKALQSVRTRHADVEALVAFHHSADCGLILTTPGGDSFELERDWELSAVSEPQLISDPLREGLALLRQGERRAALRRFIRAYEINHYRKGAYISAAVVADQLGEHPEAQTAALMGSRYFPDDAELRFLLAVSSLRQGEVEAARQALESTDSGRGRGEERFDRTLLRALLLMIDGDIRAGRRLLQAVANPESDAPLHNTMRWLRGQLFAHNILRAVAFGLMIVGFSLALLKWPVALILAAVAVFSLPLIRIAWSRQLLRTLSLSGHQSIDLIDTSILLKSLRG